MDKLPLSLTMIARNQAHNLPKSLGSVAGWVSEIVVVINDCTDDTEAVAKSFGARVEKRSWSCRRDQKNVALDLASYDWVLGLDADEVVSEELRRDIFSFFLKDHLSYVGAFFPRKTWLIDRWITHGDFYPDYNLRLFRKDKGRWGGSREHDRVIVQGKVKKLKGELLHYSFPTIDYTLTKLPEYATSFAKEALSQGKCWSWVDVLLRPPWRFFRSYILKLGFLDGFPGFYVASMAAFSNFFRYSKLFELSQNKEVLKNIKE
ncbi:glycosyltransferase family 2 protein [Candidatus Methylacidiphilum infernorum]|nr:glycosyltransferase family 2 protein [Candidatus Methylacidiphilum infernorum]